MAKGFLLLPTVLNELPTVQNDVPTLQKVVPTVLINSTDRPVIRQVKMPVVLE